MITYIKLSQSKNIFCNQCRKIKQGPALLLRYKIIRNTFEEGLHHICKECLDDAMIGPEYIMIGREITVRRIDPFVYYRDNGRWWINIAMVKGEFRTQCGIDKLNDLPVEKITLETWANQNRTRGSIKLHY